MWYTSVPSFSCLESSCVFVYLMVSTKDRQAGTSDRLLYINIYHITTGYLNFVRQLQHRLSENGCPEE